MAYDFGLGTADNGDVRAIVNNRDSTRTQYFAYDALNRIVLANTQASTGPNAWGQAFGYDPWGNLTQITVTQGSAAALSVSVNANNRISSSGYSYDAAGEALTDSVNTYTWNAEGKTATVSNSLHGSETYTYDGQGQRVMKKTAAKLYWYGTDGNVLSESDLSGNITEEYIFFGGKRIARVDAQGNVNYYLPDALGSSRVVTDSSGNILDDCDFLPFGDEQCIKSSSGNTYQFTGKERDSESGNDNFGARTYENGLGRFLSPDPAGHTAVDLSNPQTWDMYAYVRNDPTTLTDPTGLDACDSDNGACTATVPRLDNKQQMEKNQQARDQQEQLGAVLYNESAGLRLVSRNNGQGSARDLHRGREAAGEVASKLLHEGHSTWVAPNRLTGAAQHAIRTDPTARAAYEDSLSAAGEALGGENTTHGASHFILATQGKPAESYPGWARGKPVLIFGPFRNVAGRGDVARDALVFIKIFP